MRALLLFSLVLLAPALHAQPGDIYGYFVETSTGPYDPGDTFEATLMLYAGSGTPVSIGTSTMVIDYNRAAMTFPGFGEPRSGGPSGNFQWLRYDSFRSTINGGTAAYTGDVRPNNVYNNRLTIFTDLGFTNDAQQEGEVLPTTPTAVIRLRFTVVDPSLGLTITPKSQQWFDGPGGPDGAFATAAFDGLSIVQQTVSGDAGWRLLTSPISTPTVPLSTLGLVGVDELAAQNLVQGVEGYFPSAGTNLFFGYDGTAYGVPGANGVPLDLPAGLGAFWYLYDQAIATGGPSSSVPLPFTLTMKGATSLSLSPDNSSDLSPLSVSLPLHAAADGWNLVGNPAGFAVDAAGFAPVGGTFVSSVVQVWDASVGAGSYVLSTDPALNGRIAPGAGFFLQNDDATALGVPTTAVAGSGGLAPTGDSPVVRAAPAPLVAFRLDGSNSGGPRVADRAAILSLAPEASEGWDLQDAEKLRPLSPSYALLSFVGERNGQTVLKAQEARPSREAFSVPMAFETVGTSGRFEISWQGQALPDDLVLALVDHQTGTIVDLRETDRYAFSSGEVMPARVGTALPDSPAVGPVDPSATSARFELYVGRFPVAGEVGANGTPEVLALAPTTPNPFSTSTTVRFALPDAGAVRVALYDVLGREVALLADGERAAGTHEITLDARGLATGVYVIRLDADGASLSQRVTVSR
jgi:hypothetical protein